MDLNNIKRFKEIDKDGMIDHINDLPDQLNSAWQLGLNSDLPKWDNIKNVLVAGMGGSAIGADLVAAYASPIAKAPILIHRNYQLPAWANNEDTLVICASHSGNTEETLSVFEDAVNSNCKLIAITTGGKLADKCKETDIPVWLFDDDYVPRAAVGWGFGLILAVLFKLDLIPDPSNDLQEAIKSMKAQQKSLLPEIPDTGNSSKRMAGQFVGRWITIFGAGIMAPVARRWKCQINEISKAQASFEILPEASHNTIEGIQQPEIEFNHSMVVWLRAPANHPRNLLRDEFTRIGTMVQGINTDFIKAQGDNPLANIWTALHYGDYTSYYLAMAYEVDPTATPMLNELKDKMNKA